MGLEQRRKDSNFYAKRRPSGIKDARFLFYLSHTIFQHITTCSEQTPELLQASLINFRQAPETSQGLKEKRLSKMIKNSEGVLLPYAGHLFTNRCAIKVLPEHSRIQGKHAMSCMNCKVSVRTQIAGLHL